jgi:multidrug efflux pump subunit AcrB
MWLGLALAVAAGAALTLLAVHLLRQAPAFDPGPLDAPPGPLPSTSTTAPGVAVITACAGMPAPTVEKDLTNRLERWLSQSNRVLRTESRSVAGISVVWVTFQAGLTPAEAMETADVLLRPALPTLPPGTRPPVVLPWDPVRLLPLGLAVLSSATRSEAESREAARLRVVSALAEVPGVFTPGILGGRERAVAVRIDPAKVAAYGLSIADVVAALRKQGTALLPAPPGASGLTLFLDPSSVRDPARLSALVLREGPGAWTYLRDLGVIESVTLSTGLAVRVDGRPCVVVPVYRQSEDDPQEVGNGVQKALGELRRKLPDGLELSFHPEAGVVTLMVRAPTGTPAEAADQRFAAVEQVIGEVIPQRERSAVVSLAGVGADWSAVATANAGPQDATVKVLLAEAYRAKAPEYLRRLRGRLAEDKRSKKLAFAFAEGDVATSPLVDGVLCALDLRLAAPELGVGAEAAAEVLRRVAEVPGTADVHVVERLDAPYLVVEVNRDKAAALGLSAEEVLGQAVAALDERAGKDHTYWIDNPAGRAHTLTLPAPPGAAERLEKVLDTLARGGPQPVKLRSVVTVRPSTAAVEIHHAGGARVFHVWVNTEGRARAAVVADVKKALEGSPLPGNLRVEVLGGVRP